MKGRKAAAWVALACAIIAGALTFVTWSITASTANQRYASIAEVPRRSVAIVFGAGLEPDGTPSEMLADRLDAAIALRKSNVIQKLLMSGDHGKAEHDEVGAMRHYAIDRGVQSSDIVLDHAGFDTYDTCYRARAIFGVRRAVLVTQEYHLPRAVYLCRGLGVDAVGYGTPDWGRYDPRMMVRYSMREAIADARAVFDLRATHRLPRFLGPYLGMR